MKNPRIASFCVVLVLLAAAAAQASEVNVALRVRPELQFDGTEKIYFGPILSEPRADDAIRRVDLSSIQEFDRYVRRLLRRQTTLEVLPPVEDLYPPANTLLELKEDQAFWKQLAEQTGAEFVVAASIDVEVLDRAGYQTEKYVSPEDNQTYFRQVLVEETGFSYDILVSVFDGATGELLHEEQITDFKEKPVRQLDEFQGMYRDLYHVENRLLGLFVPRVIFAKRSIYR